MKDELFEELDNLSEDSFETVSVVSEDNSIIDCFVIDAILVDKIQYLLVVPCDDFDNEEAEAFILKQIEDDGKEITYAPVENDTEYNKVLILLQENDCDYEMKF